MSERGEGEAGGTLDGFWAPWSRAEEEKEAARATGVSRLPKGSRAIMLLFFLPSQSVLHLLI